MADFMETTDAKERIQNDKAFGIYDKNHDGFVTKDEVLKISGGSLTKEQVGKVCNNKKKERHLNNLAVNYFKDSIIS